MCHHGITAVVHSGITQSHTGTEKMIKLEFLKGRSPLWAFNLTQLIYLNSPYTGSPHALPLHDTHSLLSHINPLCGHPSLCVGACSVRQRCLEEQKRRRQRATRKISTFIGTFMLCFAPYVITRWVVERLGDQRESMLDHHAEYATLGYLLALQSQIPISLPSCFLSLSPPLPPHTGQSWKMRLADLVISNMPLLCCCCCCISTFSLRVRGVHISLSGRIHSHQSLNKDRIPNKACSEWDT